jgi:hypothetical protein
LFRGIKNAGDCIIKGEDEKFDRILGPRSAKVITNVIDCCFGMDSAKPPGSKVGLVDEYQIFGVT